MLRHLNKSERNSSVSTPTQGNYAAGPVTCSLISPLTERAGVVNWTLFLEGGVIEMLTLYNRLIEVLRRRCVTDEINYRYQRCVTDEIAVNIIGLPSLLKLSNSDCFVNHDHLHQHR